MEAKREKRKEKQNQGSREKSLDQSKREMVAQNKPKRPGTRRRAMGLRHPRYK
jgi:hypothetical protein